MQVQNGQQPALEPSRSGLTTGQTVARNLLYSAASQAWTLLLMIVTIPIVVHGLGESAYGIYVIATLLLSYVGFLDLGLTPAVVRSIAIHYASRDDKDLERIVGTALTLLIALGVVGAGVIALLTPFAVASILHVPTDLQADAAFVLYLAALGFGCNMFLTLFGAIPQGLQRLDLFTIRTVVFITATAIAQVLAVKLGGGLRWVAGLTIVVNVLSLAVFVIAARQLLPGVSFRPRIDRGAIRELAGFGLMRFINQASGQIVFQLDRLIVAALLPIRAVTLYSVPLTIAQRFSTIQFIFSGAFFPAASELHGAQETLRLRRLYLSSLKASLVMLLPLVILVAGFAHPILATWIGPAFAEASGDVLVILALAYGLATLIGVPALASDATGHAQWTATFAIISAIINLSLTVLLVPRLGPIGAAYALLLNAGTQGMFFLYLVQHWFVRVPLLVCLKQVAVRPLAAGAILTLYSILLSPHVDSFAALIGALAAGGFLYLVCTVIFRVWDDKEMQLARSLAGTAFSRMRGHS